MATYLVRSRRFLISIAFGLICLSPAGCNHEDKPIEDTLCPAMICSASNLRLEARNGLPAKTRVIVDDKPLIDECQKLEDTGSYRDGTYIFLNIRASRGEARARVAVEVWDLKDCVQGPTLFVAKDYLNLQFPSPAPGHRCPESICPYLEAEL